MTWNSDIPPEDSARVAEYALGLMAPDDARAFAARLSSEPALAEELVAWERHLAGLAEEEVDPVPPPPALEDRIERALFGRARTRVWSPLAIWRGLAVAGLAGTLALGAVVLLRGVPEVGPPSEAPGSALSGALLAELAPVAPGDDAARFIALYDAQQATLRIRRVAGAPVPGRARELWLIGEEAAPVSLGLLADAESTAIGVPDALRARLADAVLAVSDEPPGGSPTGAPTGAVLAAGAVLEF